MISSCSLLADGDRWIHHLVSTRTGRLASAWRCLWPKTCVLHYIRECIQLTWRRWLEAARQDWAVDGRWARHPLIRIRTAHLASKWHCWRSESMRPAALSHRPLPLLTSISVTAQQPTAENVLIGSQLIFYSDLMLSELIKYCDEKYISVTR